MAKVSVTLEFDSVADLNKFLGGAGAAGAAKTAPATSTPKTTATTAAKPAANGANGAAKATTAPAKSQAAPKATQPAATTKPAATPAKGGLTKNDVTAKCREVIAAGTAKEDVLSILADVGGARQVADIKPELYAAVIEALSAELNGEGGHKPSAAAEDDFGADAGDPTASAPAEELTV